VVPGIEGKVLVDGFLFIAEQPRGRFVSDQHHLVAAGLIFRRHEGTSGKRLYAKNIEKVAGYALCVDLFTAARHSQIRSVELICRQAGKGMTRVGKKCEIGKGNAA